MHTVRFGLVFLGKSGVNSTGLCLRENQQWFFENILTLNPASLYLGSCSFVLWLPSTPQFGDFIAYHNFCYTYHAKIFRVVLICILRHPNDNRAYPPTKARFLEDWGLDGIDVPFSISNLPRVDCISPQSSFEHSRCFDKDTEGADGAADLLEVLRNSPLEKLDFGGCGQIPSTAWQKLRGASWTNLREANFSWCLLLQTWLRCLASSLRRHVFRL